MVINAVFAEREGENIGSGVDVAVLAVHLADLVVVNKGDGNLGVLGKVLETESGVAAASDEQTDTGGNFHNILAVGD